MHIPIKLEPRRKCDGVFPCVLLQEAATPYLPVTKVSYGFLITHPFELRDLGSRSGISFLCGVYKWDSGSGV